MNLKILLAISALSLAGSAIAQPRNNSVPLEIGNRANGFDYQPTPAEVGPRERAAGLAVTPERQKQIDDELFSMDAQLLKSEGLSTSSAPGHESKH